MISVNANLKARIIASSVKPRVYIQIGDDANPLTNGNLYVGTQEFVESGSPITDIRWLGILAREPRTTEGIPLESGVNRGNNFSFQIYDIKRVWNEFEDPDQITMILEGLGGEGFTPVDGFGEGGWNRDSKYLSEKLFFELVDEIEDKPVYVYLTFDDGFTHIPDSAGDYSLLIKKGKVKRFTFNRDMISFECLDSIMELNRVFPSLDHKVENLERDVAIPKKSEEENVPTIYGRGDFPLKWIDNKSLTDGDLKFTQDGSGSPADTSTYVEEDDDNRYLTRNVGDYPPFTGDRNTEIYPGDLIEVRNTDADDYLQTVQLLTYDDGNDRLYIDQLLETTYLDIAGDLQPMGAGNYYITVISPFSVERTKFILSPEVYNIAGVLFYDDNYTEAHQREGNLAIYYEGKIFQLGENINTTSYERQFKSLLSARPDSLIENRVGAKFDLTDVITERTETSFPYRKIRQFSIFKYPYNYASLPVKYINKGVGYRDLDFSEYDGLVTQSPTQWSLLVRFGMQFIWELAKDSALSRSWRQYIPDESTAPEWWASVDNIIQYARTATDLSERSGFRDISWEIYRSKHRWLLYDIEPNADDYQKYISEAISLSSPYRYADMIEGSSAVELVYWGQFVDKNFWLNNLLSALHPWADRRCSVDGFGNNNNFKTASRIGLADTIGGGRTTGNKGSQNYFDTYHSDFDNSNSSWYQTWYAGPTFKFAQFDDSGPGKTHDIDNPKGVIDRDRGTYSEVTAEPGSEDLSDCMVYLQFPNKEDGFKWAQFIKEFNIESVDRFVLSFLSNGSPYLTKDQVIIDLSSFNDGQLNEFKTYDGDGGLPGYLVTELITFRRKITVSKDNRLLCSWDNKSYKSVYYRRSHIYWLTGPRDTKHVFDNCHMISRQQEPTIDAIDRQSLFFADPTSPADFTDQVPDETKYEANCEFAKSVGGSQAEQSDVAGKNWGKHYLASDAEIPQANRQFNHNDSYGQHSFVRDTLNISSMDDLDGLCIGIKVATQMTVEGEREDHDVSPVGFSNWTESLYPYGGIESIKFNSLQLLAEMTPEIEEIENKFSKELTGQIAWESHVNARQLIESSPANRYELAGNLTFTTDEFSAVPYSDNEGWLKLFDDGETPAPWDSRAFGGNFCYLCVTVGSNEYFTIARYWGFGSDTVFLLGQMGTPAIDFGTSYDKIEVVEIQRDDMVATQLNVIEKPQDIIYNLLTRYCPNVVPNDMSFEDITDIIFKQNVGQILGIPAVNYYRIFPYNYKLSTERAKAFEAIRDICNSANVRFTFDYKDEGVLIPNNYYNQSELITDLSTKHGTALDKLVAGRIHLSRTAEKDTYNRIEIYYNFNEITEEYESYVILDGQTVRLLTKNSNDNNPINRLCYNQDFDLITERDEFRQQFSTGTEENALALLNDNYNFYQEVKTFTFESRTIKNYVDAWHCAMFNATNRSNRKYVIKFPMTHGGMLYQPGDLIRFKTGEADALTRANLDGIPWEIIMVERDTALDKFRVEITAQQILL